MAICNRMTIKQVEHQQADHLADPPLGDALRRLEQIGQRCTNGPRQTTRLMKPVVSSQMNVPTQMKKPQPAASIVTSIQIAMPEKPLACWRMQAAEVVDGREQRIELRDARRCPADRAGKPVRNRLREGRLDVLVAKALAVSSSDMIAAFMIAIDARPGIVLPEHDHHPLDDHEQGHQRRQLRRHRRQRGRNDVRDAGLQRRVELAREFREDVQFRCPLASAAPARTAGQKGRTISSPGSRRVHWTIAPSRATGLRTQ